MNNAIPLQLASWVLMAGLLGLANEAAEKSKLDKSNWFTVSPGLNLLLITLWLCMAAGSVFVLEWALISFGLPRTTVRLGLRTFGLGVFVALLPYALIAWKRIWRGGRKEAMLGVVLMAGFIFLTPRTFTYDTGLYHLPFVQHINRLGLEWNAGWLHTRYAYFNIQLYGQAALHRILAVDGAGMLPSINVLSLTATILYLIELIQCQINKIAIASLALASCRAIWQLTIPSESSGSMHSYNADFFLGCLILATGVAIWSDPRFGDDPRRLLIPALLAPVVKVSGIACLLPFLLSLFTDIRRVIKANFFRDLIRMAIFMILGWSLILITSWIQVGYGVYPLAQTGPLRADAIDNHLVQEESGKWTIAFARYAYSGRLRAIKINAPIRDWLPAWGQSDNGRRMIKIFFLSVLSFLGGLASRQGRKFVGITFGLLMLWPVAILRLPPDPRFYLGPRLLTEFCFAYLVVYIFLKSIPGWVESLNINPKAASSFAGVYAMSCLVFVACWRHADFGPLEAPIPETHYIQKFDLPYAPRPGIRLRKVIGMDNRCWGAPSPCLP